jgi:rhomboid protease GluP
MMSRRSPGPHWGRFSESSLESETDYNKYEESDMVEMFGRMDPRRVPVGCARLKELLIERGYVVRDGRIGPGSAVPSPAKLQALIGSPTPIECPATFGQSQGIFGWLEPAHNDFHLAGSGTLQADGIHMRLSGRRAGLFGSLFHRQVQLQWRGIVDFESAGSVVHFEYRAPDSPNRAITLWFSDQSAAERLAAVVPRERTPEFRPRLEALLEFERNLIAQSSQAPVTVGLVAINTLVLIATLFAGAEWFKPMGAVQIAWGSNFGPYTTDGEWWRLFTSLFIHFGIAHLLFNMYALAAFGPLGERLYGSVNYSLIYLLAGMVGSLTSIAWHPDVNSTGASGAIFGILGALLAAQLRLRKSFPVDILRPIRSSTLIYVGFALYGSFAYKGVDYAAHLGGLACGFILGLVAARPITGDKSFQRSDLRRIVQMIPVAAGLLACGFWFAQGASSSMAGEGLYWRTVHWLRTGELATNSKYNAALTLAKVDKKLPPLAETLERDVLPFWREASERLSAIRLKPGSQHIATLDLLRDLADGRVRGYEHFEEGLRKNDQQEIASALQVLKQAEQISGRQGVDAP